MFTHVIVLEVFLLFTVTLASCSSTNGAKTNGNIGSSGEIVDDTDCSLNRDNDASIICHTKTEESLPLRNFFAALQSLFHSQVKAQH
jgi:type 1 fimbria pilin